VLLWIAQGKSNGDIAIILGCAENTIKVHLARIFEKLGFENRNAATVRALEVLSSPVRRTGGPTGSGLLRIVIHPEEARGDVARIRVNPVEWHHGGIGGVKRFPVREVG
jgi:hypothetical protein